MHNVSNIFDQLLNRSISDIVGADFTLSIPSANIIENSDSFQIVLAAPGLEKTDFQIKIENKQLVVSADKTDLTMPEGASVKRKEFNYSSFKRNFSLPENVDINNIKAEYIDGILTVTLGKKEVVKNDVRQIVID